MPFTDDAVYPGISTADRTGFPPFPAATRARGGSVSRTTGAFPAPLPVTGSAFLSIHFPVAHAWMAGQVPGSVAGSAGFVFLSLAVGAFSTALSPACGTGSFSGAFTYGAFHFPSL